MMNARLMSGSGAQRAVFTGYSRVATPTRRAKSAAIVSLFACLIPLASHPKTTAQEPVPTWRQGVSRWTGADYAQSQTPISPSPAAPVQTTPSPPRYTVPTVPGTQSGVAQVSGTTPTGGENFIDMAWLENFATSDKVVQPGSLQTPARPTTPTTAASSAVAEIAAKPGLPTIPQAAPLVEPQALNAPNQNDAPPISITEGINQGGIGDEPPLQQEIVRWYHYPWRWMTQGWKNHAELGLDGSDGNARTLALTTGLEMKRKTDAYTLGLDFDYRHATNRSETTQENGRLNLDYDRLLGDTPWSAFAKFGMEWDQFKAFDLRLNANTGLGYHWIRDDQSTLVTRFGAGASKEIGAPDDAWIPEAVLGIEAEHQLTKRQKLKGKVDYFPAWEDFNDYRLVADASWEVLLDGTDNLSLKVAVTDRYDSTPQGALPNDFYYSVLILYKF